MHSAGPGHSILELQDVSQEFQVRSGLGCRKVLRAVDNVSVALHRGDVLAVVGESGSGKTTLAKIMLGLQAPTAGSVFLEGQPLSTQKRHSISKKVQFVFQDPYSSLNPSRTVGQILRQPLDIHSIGSRSSRDIEVTRLLDQVGLPRRFVDSYPNALSGGQRQRVGIARALALKPSIIICDEPTSALDVSVQAQILNLLMDLRNQLGLTYVFVSHNLAVVDHIATSIAVMYLGRIVERYDHGIQPAHPYTRALLKSAMTVSTAEGIPVVDLNPVIPDPTNLPRGCRFNPRCPKAIEDCTRFAPPKVAHGGGYAECHLLSGIH